ncbi:MAG: DUF1624 domain-containing protein [Caldilineaceae bacterium]|nr:DUF1624 domain-containing protein [Caldilineaceae bacterium]
MMQQPPPDGVSLPQARLWEIDLLRGVAILMMVIYHLLYDLSYFRVTDTIFTNPFWFYFQRTTAGTFLVLVGVSLTLSVGAMRRRGQSERAIITRLFWRGARVFGWGLVITVATWLFFGPALAVKFGILHLIGSATVLAYPLLTLRWANLFLWLGLSGVGRMIEGVTIAGPWLLWLGIQPRNYLYVDYFPLLPWFGVILLGVFLGNLLYPNGERRFALPLSDLNFQPLRWLGERSLPIYLIHQPILFALLTPLLWLWRNWL